MFIYTQNFNFMLKTLKITNLSNNHLNLFKLFKFFSYHFFNAINFIGKISIALGGAWSEPADNMTENKEAAERRNQFEVNFIVLKLKE